MKILSLVFVLFASTASAQTLSFVIDRTLYPQLGSETPIPADLDGNATTREWVQTHYNDEEGAFEVRGVAARGAMLCTGTWFRPFEIAAAHSVPWDMLVFGAISPAGSRYRYIVIGLRGYYEIDISYGC